MTELTEITEIRLELRSAIWYLEDAELRATVREWIDESYDKDAADSADEYVENQLDAMLSEHPMSHVASHRDGKSCFPDACAGCDHYGSACPVLLDNTEIDWRERLLDQAETEHEAKRIYRRQAVDVGCHRIPQFISEWENGQGDFLKAGQKLLNQVQESVFDEDLPEPAEVPNAPALDDEEAESALATDGGGS